MERLEINDGYLSELLFFFSAFDSYFDLELEAFRASTFQQ